MFDPRDFHVFASNCSVGNPDEAACRSAISRAYYSALLVADAYIKDHGVRVSPPQGKRWGSHEKIIHAVGNIQNPSALFMKRELFKLRDPRVKADYKVGYANASIHMAKAIKDSGDIIGWLDQLPR